MDLSLVICLKALLLERYQLSLELVASFFKRLLQVAFHQPAQEMQTCIHTCRCLVYKYPKLQQMFCEDDDEVGYSIYEG